MLLLLLGHALASGLPQWPQAGATVPGECGSSLALSKGTLINPLLISDGSLARCSGVVEPLSSYAHLLAIEVHAKEVRSLYALEVGRLSADRDYWKAKAQKADPWHEQPWFVAAPMSALVTGSIVSYAWATER